MREVVLLAGCVAVVSAILAAMGFKGRQQIVGIDLGTTFSVVAIKNGDEVTVLPDRWTGKLLVPSVVSYLQNGTAVVGAEAVDRRGSHPLHTIYNSKRFIGRSFSDVSMDAAGHPYKVEANATDSAAGFAIPGEAGSPSRWVSPIDVGAEIVGHLRKSIAAAIGYDITRAVICVPAKFGSKEAEATKRAFEKAGFKVMRVMDEPTSAAVAYGLHKTNEVKSVLVYDIGGGTLDTSLLYMNGKTVSVLGVAGDDHLGGSDFDLAMLKLLQKRVEQVAGLKVQAPSLPPCEEASLRVLAERAKIELSSQESTEVRCVASDGLVRQWSVSRPEFEGAASELFSRAIQPVRKVLKDQVMTPDDVDDIVLVGGASRMPHLRSLLQEFFGSAKRLHTEIDPDVTVAFGAANIID